MSKKKEDGGPAFPHQPIGEEFTGMTLRDWFAGQVLAGLMARTGPDDDFLFRSGTAALRAYIIADAMIAEREK